MAFFNGVSPWIPLPDMPTTRIFHGAGVVADPLAGVEYIFVVGGKIDNGPNWGNRTTAFEAFQWTTKADLLVPRQYPAVGVVDNTLYVAGGNNDNCDGTISSQTIPSRSKMKSE